MHGTALESHINSTKPARKDPSAPLDPQVADRLLDLLSSDDNFRTLFMSNPREALTELASSMTPNWHRQLGVSGEFRSWRQRKRLRRHVAKFATC